ncbi:MAG: pitrilysin family protein [Dehalococcoidales bacterium]|nr:pitrilysin family protein [Dehalococcoidales bacterium]
MYRKETLDNGLKIITSAMPHTRSVSICIYLGVGSRYESDAQAGVSHFLEHLCFRGTQKRQSAKDISTAIEGVGGILNGGTDKELTVYWCKVALPHFQIALDVLIDMVLNSRFESPDIERERRVIIEEIGMSRDSPHQLVGMLIDELLWPNHPLGRDVAGTRESVGNMSREQMLDFLTREYTPQNTVVSIAGNVQHDQIVEEVRKQLGNWSNRKSSLDYPIYEEKMNPRLKVECRETEQTHLCLALPGVSLVHPKRFTLDLLNVVLGEGMSSRLFLEVRDKLGLAYNVHSYLDHFHDSGAMTVYAGVEPKNLTVSVEAILKQLALLKEPVLQEELTKAKELSKGRLMLRMEDSRSVAGWMGGQETLSGSIMTVEEVIEKIDVITAEDMAELARELFTEDKLRLSVVGPVKDEGLADLLKV